MKRILVLIMSALLVASPVGAMPSAGNPSLKEIQEGYNSGKKYQRYQGVKRQYSCPSSGYLFCNNVKVGTVLPKIKNARALYYASREKIEIVPVSSQEGSYYVRYPVLAEIAEQNGVSYTWLARYLDKVALEDERGDTLRRIADTTVHVGKAAKKALEFEERRNRDKPAVRVKPKVVPKSTFDKALDQYNKELNGGGTAEDFRRKYPQHNHHPLDRLEGESY